jgi:hypothetical protein
MRAASLLLALLAFGLGLHVLLFGHPQCFFSPWVLGKTGRWDWVLGCGFKGCPLNGMGIGMMMMMMKPDLGCTLFSNKTIWMLISFCD